MSLNTKKAIALRDRCRVLLWKATRNDTGGNQTK